jgi:hypothetical protein
MKRNSDKTAINDVQRENSTTKFLQHFNTGFLRKRIHCTPHRKPTVPIQIKKSGKLYTINRESENSLQDTSKQTRPHFCTTLQHKMQHSSY